MKRKWITILLVLSAFFLFACGLTDRILGDNEHEISTQVDEASPTEPVKTEPQQTEVTSPPTENQGPEETDEPETQAVTQSACYHPFFPIADGTFWTYEYASGGGYTITIEETSKDTFTMRQIMSDEEAEFTADWYCSEEGLLRGSFAQVDLLNQATTDGEDASEMTFETLEWEGETLPAPELMEPGYTWTSNYALSADVDLGGFSQTMEIQVSIDHEIGAIEEVTVPAGTFPDAYRVDSTGNIEMLLGDTANPLSNFEFNFSTWYVEGVGMVQSGSAFSGYSSEVILTESSLLE